MNAYSLQTMRKLTMSKAFARWIDSLHPNSQKIVLHYWDNLTREKAQVIYDMPIYRTKIEEVVRVFPEFKTHQANGYKTHFLRNTVDAYMRSNP